MKADLTRSTFDPFKHFSRVLMQQGRVQLDADWNEQAAILLHYFQALAADVIGPQGGPFNQNWPTTNFAITPIPFTPPVQNDFRIALGHYYVDGILCEANSTPVAITVQPTTNAALVDHWTLDGAPFQANQFVEVFDDVRGNAAAFTPTVVQITTPQQAQLTLTLRGLPPVVVTGATAPKLRRVFTYMTQPDYPVPDDEKLPNSGTYLIYLDVWERHITYIEDDSIREVALGGPDTATRAKVVWQVKSVKGTIPNGDKPCDTFSPTDSNFLANLFGANRGRLKAMAKLTSISTDPCIIPPDSPYGGPENQLYRVEIHRAGNAWDPKTDPQATKNPATFKWSRENGSVVFPIVSLASGSGTTTVVLENLGRDDRFGLAEGEWVEIQDDDYVLRNRPASLLQVQSVDRTTLSVTLGGTPDSNVLQNFTNGGLAKRPLLRRWDHQAGDPAESGLQLGSDGAALILEGTWLALEDGVQVWFQPPVPNTNVKNLANQYVTSDYWLIPARTATGDVEWPTEKDVQGNPVRIGKPPDGVQHHYAPLAVITLDPSGVIQPPVGDCRKSFGNLAGSASARAAFSNTIRNSLSPGPVAPASFADVAGLGEARANALAQSGIDSVEKLARATPEQVAKALKGTGVSPQHATDFIEKAKQLISTEKKQ